MDVALGTINSKRETKITSYKPLQEQTLKLALHGDVISMLPTGDVISMLPTGYGKTLIIEILPYLTNSTVLLVTPLDAILTEQMGRFGDSSVLAQDVVAMDEPDFRTIKYIIGHPETITGDRFKSWIMAKKPKISHVVVDEAHCVLSWGKSLFRPSFLKLGDLRAILPKAHMLCLTATAPAAAIEEMSSTLRLTEPQIIKETPDRPNIYLECRERTKDAGEDGFLDVMEPLLKELKELGSAFPKTIVYCPLKYCGIIHQFSKGFVKEGVAQYHSQQTCKMKTYISQEMRKIDGKVRLLLATEAYGMGADPPDVRRIVHIGPPSSIETYTQEIGRCGRDGEFGIASILFNKADLAKSHISKAMKDYVSASTCRRKFLLAYFGFTPSVNTRCCDICQSSRDGTSSEMTHILPREVKKSVRNALNVYFVAENECTNQFSEVTSSLNMVTLDKIVANLEYISTVESFKSIFPHIDVCYAENIVVIVNGCLGR